MFKNNFTLIASICACCFLEHELHEYRAECVCSMYLEYHKYLRIVFCVDPCDALKKYHDCTENVRFELKKNLLFQVFC